MAYMLGQVDGELEHIKELNPTNEIPNKLGTLQGRLIEDFSMIFYKDKE